MRAAAILAILATGCATTRQSSSVQEFDVSRRYEREPEKKPVLLAALGWVPQSVEQAIKSQALMPRSLSFATGARLDMGGGSSDYIVSDGNSVRIPGGVGFSDQAANHGIYPSGSDLRARVPTGFTFWIQESGGNVMVQATNTEVRIGGGGGYVAFAKQGAGAPTAADCDNDAEVNRLYRDTTSNRLYICAGATRGWDYTALTD